jgi:tyrosine-protein kinase Etk/Wzc
MNRLNMVSSTVSDVSPEDRISVLDLLYVVARYRWLLILGPCFAGLATLAITFLIKPTFTATTKFLPPQQQQSAAVTMLQNLGSLGGLASSATGIKNPADQYIALMRTRTIEDAIVEKFKLANRYGVTLKEDAASELEAHVSVVAGKDGLISLDASDGDPAFAANLANSYVEELRKLLDKLALTEAQQRRLFFERQLQQTKKQLAQAEVLLKNAGFNTSVLKSSSSATISAAAQLQAEITAQEVRIGAMRGYLTESSPEYKRSYAELQALKVAQEKMAKGDTPSTEDDNGYPSRFRDVKYFEYLFEMYAKQFELARLDESREGAVIQVVDVARVPEKKSKPKKAMIVLLSVFVAEIFLLFFVFVRQAIRQQSDDPQFVEKMVRLRQALS